MYAAKKPMLVSPGKRTPGAAAALRFATSPISPFEAHLMLQYRKWHLQQEHQQEVAVVMDSDDTSDLYSEMSEGYGSEEEEQENNAITEDMECEVIASDSMMLPDATAASSVGMAAAAVTGADSSDIPLLLPSIRTGSLNASAECTSKQQLALFGAISASSEEQPPQQQQQQLPAAWRLLTQQDTGSSTSSGSSNGGVPSTPPPSPLTPHHQLQLQQRCFAQQLQLESVAWHLLSAQNAAA